ncbi:MAG TPA: GntR family transcriptional regulator [Longimicrobiaceae bacterium]|nr:GntR family transcriptional regulator [Longimicrobiaceae bacterium]
MTSVITRVPLREQVHHAIVQRILLEELEPGSRISDTALAGELGVSRTPIREALLRLEREGFLDADVGRGFFVKALSTREVRDVYPVLWALEVLALRSSPAPGPARLAELERINAELERERAPERRIDLDVRWHRTLVEGCGNAFLLGTIDTMKLVIRRYEYAYMQNAGYVPRSTRTHAQIARALAERDVEGGVARLEENWHFGMERILEWLRTGT